MVRYVWIGTMLAISVSSFISPLPPHQNDSLRFAREHAASREIWGPTVATASSGGCSTSSRARHLSTSTHADVPGARSDQAGRGTVEDLPQRP